MRRANLPLEGLALSFQMRKFLGLLLFCSNSMGKDLSQDRSGLEKCNGFLRVANENTKKIKYSMKKNFDQCSNTANNGSEYTFFFL